MKRRDFLALIGTSAVALVAPVKSLFGGILDRSGFSNVLFHEGNSRLNSGCLLADLVFDPGRASVSIGDLFYINCGSLQPVAKLVVVAWEYRFDGSMRVKLAAFNGHYTMLTGNEHELSIGIDEFEFLSRKSFPDPGDFEMPSFEYRPIEEFIAKERK